MISFRGYVYESVGPDMPIIAVIFDEKDVAIETRVVCDAEAGIHFVAAFLSETACRRESMKLKSPWMAR